MSNIRIGTSGWHYKHWLGPFYPPGFPPAHMLDFYCRRFDTVEINNSFYRLPTLETAAAWREAVPPGFLFAVKASRYLTHMKKLRDPEAGLDRFLPVVDTLGPRCGPILFQLPPRWAADPDRLAGFLQALPSRHRHEQSASKTEPESREAGRASARVNEGRDRPGYVFEFRDRSWFTPRVFSLLSKHKAAFCIYDQYGFTTPFEFTGDFAYIRLHGPAAPRRGDYTDRQMAEWARRIREWAGRLKTVYVYFNNDPEGHAVHNALKLKELLGVKKPRIAA